MKMINLDNSDQRPGHYSPGVVSNGFLFVSGQLPIDWQTGKLVSTEIEAQTIQTLENLKEVLAGAGAAINDVVKVTIYVNGVELWPSIDHIYASYFGSHKPSRSVVPTMPLHYGALVEIEAIAYLSDQD